MKMDLCKALSTLYTSVMSILPDGHGGNWGISGIDLNRNDLGALCQMDVMFVGCMNDNRTSFSGSYRVWYNIWEDSLKEEMLFVNGISVYCPPSYVMGCLCASIRFFLDWVDESGKLQYRVCNTLKDKVTYGAVGYKHILKTCTVSVEEDENGVKYLIVPRDQLFYFNFYDLDSSIFESKFYEIRREALENYGPDIMACKSSKEVLDVCCMIESTEEVFLKSALEVLLPSITRYK